MNKSEFFPLLLLGSLIFTSLHLHFMNGAGNKSENKSNNNIYINNSGKQSHLYDQLGSKYILTQIVQNEEKRRNNTSFANIFFYYY